MAELEHVSMMQVEQVEHVRLRVPQRPCLRCALTQEREIGRGRVRRLERSTGREEQTLGVMAAHNLAHMTRLMTPLELLMNHMP